MSHNKPVERNAHLSIYPGIALARRLRWLLLFTPYLLLKRRAMARSPCYFPLHELQLEVRSVHELPLPLRLLVKLLDPVAMIWYGFVDMAWYGMVWYGVVWYGMVWGGMYGEIWGGWGANAWYGIRWIGVW